MFSLDFVVLANAKARGDPRSIRCTRPARTCAFTSFMETHYTESDVPTVQAMLCDWVSRARNHCPLQHIVVGVELGHKERHLHLQGCAYFSENFKLNDFATAFTESAPPEVGEVTFWKKACKYDYVKFNVPYCKKDGHFYEWGELPLRGQKSSLLEQCMVDIRGGMRNLRELRANHPAVMARYEVFVKAYLNDTYVHPVQALNFYPWQQQIVDLLEKCITPHHREVLFICDPNGGAGKTTLLMYLVAKYKDRVYAISPTTEVRSHDLAYMLPDGGMELFICDVSRSANIPYEFIEMVKNGYVTSTKYHGINKMFPQPHVVVFTNLDESQLERTKLSADRLNVVSLTTDAGSGTAELFKQ